MLRTPRGLLAVVVIALSAGGCRHGASGGQRVTGEDYRGTDTWTVGGRSFWIDVPVALPPPGRAGAMSASTDGTADLLFPGVKDAGSVRVGLNVASSAFFGDRSRLRLLRLSPPGGGFVPAMPGSEPTKAVTVPGSAEAYYGVGAFIKPEAPARRAVRFVLHADSGDGERFWYVSASANGPADHPLLARDSRLLRLLEQCVRSFSLKARPVARLPVAKAPPTQVRPATIDAVAVQPTGAPTARDAFRLSVEAMARGDAAAWSRVVVYGYGEPFTKAYDDSNLATMRLARAVRRKPIPGIESYVIIQQAIERSREAEQMLDKLDSLPLPPREGERVDGGATGGPMHIIERKGRFFIERFVIEDDPESKPFERGPVHPWVQAFMDGWRASAIAYDEAAALHLAGRFRDIGELEDYVERRRKQLAPARPEADE